MTLVTIRAGDVNINQMYMFAEDIIGSDDIAAYIATTHGGKDVAAGIYSSEYMFTALMVVFWFAAAFQQAGVVIGDMLTDIAKANWKWEQISSETLKYDVSAVAKYTIGYSVLLEAWFHFWMFILGSTATMNTVLSSSDRKANECRWDKSKIEKSMEGLVGL